MCYSNHVLDSSVLQSFQFIIHIHTHNKGNSLESTELIFLRVEKQIRAVPRTLPVTLGPQGGKARKTPREP